MVESFVNHVENNYLHYCKDRSDKRSCKDLLAYLIQHNLISKSIIRHYVILEEYHRLQSDELFSNHTKTIEYLAREFQLHNSTVRLIITKHSQKFHPIKQ